MMYGLSIFLSAFLLFELELVTAKQLLPWFGGAPAVWATAQVFYQLVLLAGYAYAHALVQNFFPRTQRAVHLAVLGCAGASLVALALTGGIPLLAPAGMKPSGVEMPLAQLLKILLLTNALPFFALSATGPLLQSWHGRTSRSLDRTYRLYALSNVGSLLGLLLYPLVVERLCDLPVQAWLWTGMFTFFAISCAAVSWQAGRVTALRTATPGATGGTAPLKSGAWLWILLPLVTSALFLATTNALCQEVAVIPFLWVLPLAVYLGSFILCFDHPRWYSRSWSMIGALAAGLLLVVKPTSATVPIAVQILVYCVFLASICMVCHGELVRLRPPASDLTRFYLWIAIGGAVGGALVSFVAPAVLRGFWEFRIAMLVAWVAVGWAWWLDRSSPFHAGDRRFYFFFLLLASLVITPFVLVNTPLRAVPWVVHHPWAFVLLASGLVAVAAGGLTGRGATGLRPLWPRGLVISVLGLSALVLINRIGESRGDTVFSARNFFGLLRVIAVKDRLTDNVVAYKLIHGITNHGVQFTDPRWRDRPTTYYSPNSGVGLAARFLEARAPRLNFGVLGLGAGTTASYARRGDSIRFYELDPAVIHLVDAGSPYFSFLRDCLGRVATVAGDARLSLAREAADGNSGRFDLLALDAFSGDAIPVHLLTVEAFQLYSSHLRDRSSILAVHVTNAYLDLEPVVAAAAHAVGLQGVRVDATGAESQLPEPSSWILLSRQPEIFAADLFRSAGARPLRSREVLFTDRYNNLFRVLK